MSLGAREDSLLTRHQQRHQIHLPPMPHLCKVCKNSTKRDIAVCRNTTNTWEQLGLDIFSLRNTQHLLVIDYFSWFPVIKQLQSLHSVSVIKHLKDISQNRCSQMYNLRWWHIVHLIRVQRLHKNMGIQHTVTSPTNAQSNRQAEHFVQTIKNSLTKAIEGGEDPHLAILTYITTLLNHSLPSLQSYSTLKNTDVTSSPDQATKPHPLIQEHNAETETLSDQVLQQKCQGPTQS